jgi:hypothetical protein
MAFQIGSNFELNAQLPLDVRTVVSNITARNALVPSKVYQGSIVYVISEDKYYYYNTSNQWVVFNTGSAGGSNNFTVENVVYTTGNIDIFDQKRFENATTLEVSPFLYSGLGKYTENYFYALLSGGSGSYNSPTTRNSVVFLNFDKEKNEFKEDKIIVKMSDNLSGIKSYRGTIDGVWILMQHNTKEKTITYYFDEKLVKMNGKHNFVATIIDKKGNLKKLTTTFNY